MRNVLSEDVEVKGAQLKNGILVIQLEQIIPERKKPKKNLFEKINESPSVFSARPTYWESYFHTISTSTKESFSSFDSYKEPGYDYTPIPKFQNSKIPKFR